jgi:hypothetical protein
MPGVVQPGVEGTREDLSDEVFMGEAWNWPYLAMINKGGPPMGFVHMWQGKKQQRGNKRGIVDATPAGDPQPMSLRDSLESNIHWVREEVMVGKLTKLLSNIAGVGSGEDILAEEIAEALNVVSQMADEILCDNEPQRDQGGAEGSEMYGIFDVLDTDGGGSSNRAVPTDHRIPSDSIFTGNFSDFEEDDLRNLAASQYKAANKALGRVPLVLGIDLKRRIGDWSLYSEDQTGMTAVREFHNNSSEKILRGTVDIVEADGATYELHLSTNLLWDRDSDVDTAGDTYQHKAGFAIPTECAELMVAQEPSYFPLDGDGGGDAGYVDAVYAHKVYPKWGMKIHPTGA